MRPETVQALNRINLYFYASPFAEQFDATRQGPWPGWNRVLAALPAPPGPDLGRSVLDVGCGNGRFAEYLDERWGVGFRYLGIDASEPLVKMARSRGLDSERIRFALTDISAPAGEQIAPTGAYSLIVAFGLLHHIPGFDRRRRLLETLLRGLRTDGRLAVTFWRFAVLERFGRKLHSWAEYNRKAAQPIDLNDLEPGDHLLVWGTGGEAFRYCHFADDQEIQAMLGLLDAECVERFTSDGETGELNQYVVLARIPRG